VLLLTKCDLAPDAEALSAELAGIALSCAVHRVSSLTGEGLDEVRALLRSGRTMAMLGSSGVGKSSLLNALAAADVMRVRALRADGKGRHTTVTRELHRVCGGAVIDCPGVRAVALDDGEGVDGVFPEIADLARACRFSDCAHAGEPGCAVDEAVQEGSLDPDRLDSWRSLRAEGRRQELRRDARLRAEERRRRRVWAKSVRDLPSRPQTR
jgi:ribosome biogenesis GTPase